MASLISKFSCAMVSSAVKICWFFWCTFGGAFRFICSRIDVHFRNRVSYLGLSGFWYWYEAFFLENLCIIYIVVVDPNLSQVWAILSWIDLVNGRRCWIDLNFLNIKSKTSLLRNKGIYTKNMLVLSVLPFLLSTRKETKRENKLLQLSRVESYQ